MNKDRCVRTVKRWNTRCHNRSRVNGQCLIHFNSQKKSEEPDGLAFKMTKCDCNLRGKWARPEGHRRGPATMAAFHFHLRHIGIRSDLLELHVNRKEAADFFRIGTYLFRNSDLNFGFLGLPIVLESVPEKCADNDLCHWYLKKVKP